MHELEQFILGFMLYLYPYKKVTGCLSISLYVPKGLANRLTDMFLPYSVASHMSWGG